MTIWIRIAIVLSMIAASYGLGTYVKGKFEKAALADKLQEQIAAANEQIELKNALAVKTEADLQTERAANAELNRKWNKIRASKDRSVCLLDADTISLLQSAGSGSADAR